MFRKNPKLEVKLTDSDRKIVKLGWFFITIHFCISLYFYFDLPEKIPIHYNLKGEVNGYGSRSTWWLLFIINLLIYYGLSVFTTRTKPWKFNSSVKLTQRNAEKVYGLTLQMLVVLNSTIAFLMLFIAIDIILKVKVIDGFQLSFAFIPLCGFLALIPFFYIYKMLKVPK